jgi:signal transduction histidine kinase
MVAGFAKLTDWLEDGLARALLRWGQMALLLFACALAPHGRAAVPALEVARLQQMQILNPYWEVLPDARDEASLQQVQQAHFVPAQNSGESLDYGMRNSAFWLRLTLQNSSDQAFAGMLEIAHQHFRHLQLYFPESDGQYRLIQAGTVLPFEKRIYPNRFFVFPLSVAAHQRQVLYLRIGAPELVIVPGRIWQRDAFYEYELHDYMQQAWFFGLVMALVAFNLLLFMVLKDVSYLLYCTFAEGNALMMAFDNGIGAEFLWPSATVMPQWGPLVGFSLNSAVLLLFMRRMLQTKTHLPWLDPWLKFLFWMQLVLPLQVLLALDWTMLPTLISHFLTAVAIVATSILCAAKRVRSAWFFLASFAVIMGGLLVTVAQHLGHIPGNAVSTGSTQLAVALQMLILAFALVDRFNVVLREKDRARRHAEAAQQQLLENLQSSEKVLAQQVEQRTAALRSSNAALSEAHAGLSSAYDAATASRQAAEQAQQQATRSLEELKHAQLQLVQAEKLSALGQLVAGVAHEINNPVGAVQASGQNIADALQQTMQGLSVLVKMLDLPTQTLFLSLFRPGSAQVLGSRAERTLTRALHEALLSEGVPEARHKAGMLMHLNVQPAQLGQYWPMLHHPQADLILQTAHNGMVVIKSAANINLAVERVDKVVFALQSFVRLEHQGQWQMAHLHETLDSVLTIYRMQMKHDVQLERHYQAIAPLWCLPDQLHQVWINLIHNALHAMQFRGCLSVAIERVDDWARVSISDTGVGIAPEHRSRIFEAFFTTKPTGEGSGLGLDVVQKIVGRHQGRIELDSEVGRGSTFSVWLPYREPDRATDRASDRALDPTQSPTQSPASVAALDQPLRPEPQP